MTGEPERDNEQELARKAYEAWHHYLKAFDALTDCSRERIVSYCGKLLKNDADGEDAASEAFQRVYKSFATLQSPEAYKVWLFRIARNCCFDLLKKRGRILTNVQEEDNDLFANLPDPSDPIAEIHQVAANHEAVCAVKAAIAERDSLDQKIFEMLFIQDIANIAEISRKLEKRENTIRSRVLKIREMMAEIGQRLKNNE